MPGGDDNRAGGIKFPAPFAGESPVRAASDVSSA